MKNKAVLKLLMFAGVSFAVLLLFINLNTSAPNLPIRGEGNLRTPENLESNVTLQADTDELLTLFDKMAQVPIYLKDEPINKSGTNTERGVAYTLCEDFETPKIILKKSFYQRANQKQLTNILKHELTHAWLCRQKQMSGHDENFRRKFKEVGGFGN